MTISTTVIDKPLGWDCGTTGTRETSTPARMRKTTGGRPMSLLQPKLTNSSANVISGCSGSHASGRSNRAGSRSRRTRREPAHRSEEATTPAGNPNRRRPFRAHCRRLHSSTPHRRTSKFAMCRRKPPTPKRPPTHRTGFDDASLPFPPRRAVIPAARSMAC